MFSKKNFIIIFYVFGVVYFILTNINYLQKLSSIKIIPEVRYNNLIVEFTYGDFHKKHSWLDFH